MKTLKYWFLLISLLMSLITKSDGTELMVKTSEIKKVTVFLNGAQLSRTCSLSVPAGNTDVVISNLSSKIEESSLQVKATGDVIIMSVKLRTNYLDKRQNTFDRKQLEAQLKAINKQEKEHKMLKAVYEGEQGVLLANQNLGSETEGFTAKQLQEIVEYHHTKLLDIRSKILELDLQLESLQEQISRLTKQLNESANVEKSPINELVVSISAKKECNTTFLVEYYINDAHWVPFYDARVEDVNKPIELSRKAQVYQNTGEDWDKVQLTLSSANPQLSGSKPELYPTNVDFVAAEPRRNMVLQSQAMDDSEDLQIKEDVKVQKSSSNIKGRSTDFMVKPSAMRLDFVIENPYTIPSDNKPYTVAIGQLSIPAIYEYQIVPKLDPSAFIVARITNWDQYDLLDGTVNLYFQQTYIGKTFLNTKQVTDTLGFSLGRDPFIVTTRKSIKEFSSDETIGSDRKLLRNWEITVRNTKRTPVTITLEDQVPISQSRDVDVYVYETGGATYNPKTGKLTWNFTLEPSSSKQFTFKYRVKYPKSKGTYTE